MNHPGEIAPLARLARPHVAMVTTVAPAHWRLSTDIEGIAREKAAIFEGLEPGGTAILNADTRHRADPAADAARRAGARIVQLRRDRGRPSRLVAANVAEGDAPWSQAELRRHAAALQARQRRGGTSR